MSKFNMMKNYTHTTLITTLFFLFSLSCTSDKTKIETIKFNEIEVNQITTRSVQKKINSKAFYYNSLATFGLGSNSISINNLAEINDKDISFVLLYDAIAPWAENFKSGQYDQTGNETLNNIMSENNLNIIEQFEIDKDNEGIVLEPIERLSNPIDIAKKLSMIEYVFMVHLKETPEENDNLSADLD